MIIEKLLDNENLTDSEQLLAEYLLDKNNHISNLTSKELGRRSFTSQGTVTRLYKKLGIKNYREFISGLIIERNEYFKTDIESETVEEHFTSLKDIEQVIFGLYKQTMAKTNIKLDQNTFIRVCNRILQARSIDIYGIGISDTVAKQMSFKLQSLDLPATYQNGLNAQYLKNMRNKKTNVSILITLVGKNIQILQIAKILKEYNIYTVALIGRKEQEIISLCNDYLLFDTTDFTDIDCMISTFSAEYMINLIYAAIIYRLRHPYIK